MCVMTLFFLLYVDFAYQRIDMNPFLLSPRSGSLVPVVVIKAKGTRNFVLPHFVPVVGTKEQWSWGNSVIIVVLAVRGDTMGCAW